jgi:hypothetical protein
MFKKSDKNPQLDAFMNVPNYLDSSAAKVYEDQKHWHNQFREQVILKIDESKFEVLFNSKTGAPNAPIRLLVGMMILKEAFGWSDSQLFEQCQFNLLIRSALGLVNIDDAIPVQSTYYLLRQKLHQYQVQKGEDLFEKTFKEITNLQVKQFNVNGREIRMDSKLFGSNIANYSRYEIIVQTLKLFCKSVNPISKRLSPTQKEQLEQLLNQDPEKTIYHSTKEEITERLQSIGMLIYKLLKHQQTPHSEGFNLLKRVFNEQYIIVSKKKKVTLRPKEEISSSSLQSPHDPDCTYRNKGGQKVKGYSANLTETCSDEGLNLITSVMVEPANTSDSAFVEKAIEDTKEITDQPIETAYMDGGYQTPDNDIFSKGIDMVYTGIQGAISRYDLELKPDGLWVTDSQTGEKILAKEVKKQKNSTEDRCQIKTPEGKYRYFGQTEIRASELRRQIKQRPLAQTQKRNNVEATIYHFGCELKKQKTKYRGLIKQKIWSFCRCLWINLVRITKYAVHLDRKTNTEVNNQGFLHFFMLTSFMMNQVIQKLHNLYNFSNRILNNFTFIKRLSYYGVA